MGGIARAGAVVVDVLEPGGAVAAERSDDERAAANGIRKPAPFGTPPQAPPRSSWPTITEPVLIAYATDDAATPPPSGASGPPGPTPAAAVPLNWPT